MKSMRMKNMNNILSQMGLPTEKIKMNMSAMHAKMKEKLDHQNNVKILKN